MSHRRVFLFNPYTGKPRHPSDIASDPEGFAIVEPGAPVLTARITSACQLRQQAKSDTSCVGAFARARPGAKP